MRYPRSIIAKRRGIHASNGGFTVLELLISTAVFSVVLLLCATAIVQTGRMFYKGATVNRTQDTTRQVVDDVVQALQFGSKATPVNFRRTGTGPGGVVSLCLGEVRYSFNPNVSQGSRAGQSRHILWKDHVGASAACPGLDLNVTGIPVGSSADGVELVGGNMRVPVLSATDAGNSLWRVDVTVSYGEDPNLFVGTPAFSHCVGRDIGGQFCASSSVGNIFVAKRL